MQLGCRAVVVSDAINAGDAELARLIAAVKSAADAVRAHADEALRADADRNQPGLFQRPRRSIWLLISDGTENEPRSGRGSALARRCRYPSSERGVCLWRDDPVGIRPFHGTGVRSDP